MAALDPSHVAKARAKADRFITFLLDRLPAEVFDLAQMRTWGDHDWQRVTDWKNEAKVDGDPVLADHPVETVPCTSRSAIIVGLREHQRCAADAFASLPGAV